MLDYADLCVKPGEGVGLVGQSGSGKSMLMRCAMGLPPLGLWVRGTIRLLDVEFEATRAGDAVSARRRSIAYIAQNPYAGFVPDVAVGVQIHYLAHSRGLDERYELREHSLDLLARLGLKKPDRVLDSMPSHLSGGQLQRLQIATAILVRPSLIMADEITAHLDPVNASRVADALAEQQRQKGTTILLASHDHGLIRDLCTRWYRIDRGSVLPQ